MWSEPNLAGRASMSAADLDLYQDSSGFIQMDDSKDHYWGQDGASLGRSKSSIGTRSRSKLAQDRDRSDHVYYAVSPYFTQQGVQGYRLSDVNAVGAFFRTWTW